MKRSVSFYLACGITAAGLLCLVVGLIVYFATKSGLATMIFSLFAIIAGAIMSGVGILILLVLLIMWLIEKRKGESNEEDEEK